MAEIGEQYKGKLIVEYQKYDNLEEMYNNIKKNYEQKMIDVDKSTKEQLDGMKLEFDKVVSRLLFFASHRRSVCNQGSDMGQLVIVYYQLH